MTGFEGVTGVILSTFVADVFDGVVGLALRDLMDLIEDAELSGRALRLGIGGAWSSTNQLHCLKVNYMSEGHPELPTYPEEFAQGRIIWLARLPLDVFEILGEPKPQHL